MEIGRFFIRFCGSAVVEEGQLIGRSCRSLAPWQAAASLYTAVIKLKIL
jgi:hypothetical protein